jgi:hypothetical protein
MADQTNGIGTQSAIDRLETQQNEYLDQQQKLNDQIVDTGVQKMQSQVDFEKQQYQQEAEKNARALYTNYQKEQNQYGANAEALASQGLANSGYAESSRVNLYNNYQNNVTSLMNEMNREKAVLDQQMNQAYFDADIQKAQNLATIYTQKMQMAMNMYQTRYTLYRDQVADEQWAAEYELQKRQLELSQANSDRDYQLQLMQLQNS